eukprot:325304-Amphidinium_carterae.1
MGKERLRHLPSATVRIEAAHYRRLPTTGTGTVIKLPRGTMVFGALATVRHSVGTRTDTVGRQQHHAM